VSLGTPAGLDPALDGELLCYCTRLTFGELRAACAAGAWPPPSKERTGRLCTGCQGDLQHCLRLLGARAPA
jgi:hypothetical protein